MIRTIPQLRDVPDPAWPMLAAAIARAPSEVVVLPVDAERGETTPYQLQVTARSPMGAMALHTAGVLVDHGWLRLLGGGEGLMNFVSGNGIAASPQQTPDRLLVGFDVLGGRYEVNGGALPGEPGQVCYFAPTSWPGYRSSSATATSSCGR